MISVGRTVTYIELARWISPVASPRIVARACAANRIALAIPRHRVVGSRGDLCDYRWGLERKRQLIKMEAMAIERTLWRRLRRPIPKIRKWLRSSNCHRLQYTYRSAL